MVDVTKRESLLSMQQAADTYGVHIKTIYGWVRRGLESAKVGGKRFTTKEAIQFFSKQGAPSADSIRRATQKPADEADEAVRKILRDRFGIKY